jgi:putative membrane protein
MADGLARTGSAVGALRSGLPPDEDLARLREAAAQMATAQQSLARALRELEAGARRLHAGHGELIGQVGNVPFVGEALTDGAQKLQAGTEQLRAGLAAAGDAAGQLQAGGTRLSEGVAQLTQGVGAAAGGLAQLDAALPPPAVLEQATAGGPRLTAATARVAQGSGDLAEGAARLQQALGKLDEAAQKLSDGVGQLQARLPSPPTPPEGTAAGLSESVKPELQFSARVPNQGTAMAPYFVPLSLWVGATLCAVLFAYHRLPRPLVGLPRLGIVLGKLCVPGLVLLAQSGLLAGMLLVLLNVQVAHPGRFVTTLVLTALTFGALLMVLVQLFGSAGKLLAVILLAMQLAASGTMVPIELTSRFFQALHPWLPLTWSIKATRIAMFDAYGGAWLQSIGAMVAMLGAALLVATLVGRWKAVDAQDYRPMLD